MSDATTVLFGLRFPPYFTHRDKWKVIFVGIEPDLLAFIKLRVKPGMTVLDIGGSVGLLCRAFSKAVGPQGRVWSFEPDPSTRPYLEHNVRSCSNARVSSLAICERSGHSDLFIHPLSGTGNSLLPLAVAQNSVRVPCCTLDAFLVANRDIQPDIVKIDVEGAEPQVLCGMQETIRRFPDIIIVIEFCPDNLAAGGVSPGLFYKMLADSGLQVELILVNGNTVSVAGIDDLLSRLGSAKYCNLLCRRNRRLEITDHQRERCTK